MIGFFSPGYHRVRRVSQGLVGCRPSLHAPSTTSAEWSKVLGAHATTFICWGHPGPSRSNLCDLLYPGKKRVEHTNPRRVQYQTHSGCEEGCSLGPRLHPMNEMLALPHLKRVYSSRGRPAVTGNRKTECALSFEKTKSEKMRRDCRRRVACR